MKAVLHLSVIAFLIFSELVSAETPLQRELQKNSAYHDFQNSIKNDPALSQAGETFQSVIEKQKVLEKNPNERARLFYQNKSDNSPCAHCPRYLDLITEVNQIVDKVKSEDVSLNNEKMIQLSRLKFLYFTTKTTMDDGKVRCQTNSHLDMWDAEELKKGTMELVAEEALALPKVTDVQFYSKGDKEVHYYYQGEGIENETIVEVIIHKDNTATMKYYKYESGMKLPTLGGEEETQKKREGNYVDINPEVETEKLLLPTDVKLGKTGTEYSLSEALKMKQEVEINFNQQKTNVSVEDVEGNKYLVLEGVNTSGGTKQGAAIINYDFTFDKDSALKLGSSITSKIETSDVESGGIINNQELKLGLTDHNHEYLNVHALLDNAGVASYSLSNKYKAGEGSLGGDIQVNRNGDQSVGMTLEKQAGIDTMSVRYSRDIAGNYKYNASAGTNLDQRTKLSTEFSTANGGEKSIALNFEKNISETTSMVLTVTQNEQRERTFLYQMQSKF